MKTSTIFLWIFYVCAILLTSYIYNQIIYIRALENIEFTQGLFIEYEGSSSSNSKQYMFVNLKNRFCEESSTNSFEYNMRMRFGFLGSSENSSRIYGYNNYRFYYFKDVDFEIDTDKISDDILKTELSKQIKEYCNFNIKKYKIYGIP